MQTAPQVPIQMQKVADLIAAVNSIFPSSEVDLRSSVDLRISMADFDQHSSSTSSIKLCYQDSYETNNDRNNSNLTQEESAIVFTFIPNPGTSFSTSNYEEYFKAIIEADDINGVLGILSGNTFKWTVTSDYSRVTLTLKFATTSALFGLIQPFADMITKAGISPGALLELLFSESYQPTNNLSSYASTSSSSGTGIKAQFRIKAEISRNFLKSVAHAIEQTEEPGLMSQLVSTFKKLHFDFEFEDIKKELYDFFDQSIRNAGAPVDAFKDFETLKSALLNPMFLSIFARQIPELNGVLRENANVDQVKTVLPSVYTDLIAFFAGVEAVKFILGTDHSLVIKTNNLELVKLLPTAEDLIEASKVANIRDDYNLYRDG